MPDMPIGEYIKRRRLELGITQSELCEGCCAASTLSRLESGRQMPGRALVHALFQRLGLSEDRYFMLPNQNEAAVERLKKEIRAGEISFHRALPDQRPQIREEVLDKLARLEALTEKDDSLTRQFMLNAQITLGKPEGPYSSRKKLELLLEAIRMTVPRFDMDHIDRFRYSINETTIINKIANTYAAIGEKERAASLYSQLLNYVESNDQKLTGFANHYCLVAHNYAIYLALDQQYPEAIALAERGWELCVSYGDYQFLPGFLAILAECYFFIGDKKKSTDLYYQAYNIYRALGEEREQEIIRREMQEHLGLTPPN